VTPCDGMGRRLSASRTRSQPQSAPGGTGGGGSLKEGGKGVRE
jgi:hypothetical protein